MVGYRDKRGLTAADKPQAVAQRKADAVEKEFAGASPLNLAVKSGKRITQRRGRSSTGGPTSMPVPKRKKTKTHKPHTKRKAPREAPEAPIKAKRASKGGPKSRKIPQVAKTANRQKRMAKMLSRAGRER